MICALMINGENILLEVKEYVTKRPVTVTMTLIIEYLISYNGFIEIEHVSML